MEVIIQKTTEQAVELTAKIIAENIGIKPDFVLGLATGRTMEAVYAELSRMHREDNLDFSLCKTFNLDEYIGLPPEDKNSYRYYMNYHLFNRINIDKRNTHLPNGMAEDEIAEGKHYEDLIKRAGGIDLQLLGIGSDGHIGFNEPISALFSRTRAKSLTPATYAQNSPLFDNPEDMPKRAFTMGVGTIMEARRILMLVTGASKAEILAKAIEGPLTSMVTASAIQLHASCTVIVDEAAAADLKEKDYYRWIFENEPEWQKYRQ